MVGGGGRRWSAAGGGGGRRRATTGFGGHFLGCLGSMLGQLESLILRGWWEGGGHAPRDKYRSPPSTQGRTKDGPKMGQHQFRFCPEIFFRNKFHRGSYLFSSLLFCSGCRVRVVGLGL